MEKKVAKKTVTVEEDTNLDLETINESHEVEVPTEHVEPIKVEKPLKREEKESFLVSCLRKETIVVRHIPKESGMITNPKHVFYGGMAENAVRVFTVPILESNGQFVNVLTNEEKAYLEDIMGLEINSLSIYKRENNFWANYYVRLGKGETFLDLSNPDDYIKYKVLLANKDYIASSLQELQDKPKATFQYVLISENEEDKQNNLKLNATMASYVEFGKYQSDVDVLRVIIETLDGRPTSPRSKLEFLQNQASKLIQSDAKLFLRTIKDPLLQTRVLIKKGLEGGIISKRGDYFYLKQDNSPLCEPGEDPTATMAAKYLNSPKHQEIKFMIEAKLK